jgi:hypothetical protein
VAAECGRVLRQRGRLCLRTASREKIPVYPYLPFFPSSRVLLEEQVPALDFQRAVFEAASLQLLFSGVVTQQIASDYSDYADKLSAKADSILAQLTGEEFDAGIQALRSDPPPGPVFEPIDLLVFEK